MRHLEEPFSFKIEYLVFTLDDQMACKPVLLKDLLCIIFSRNWTGLRVSEGSWQCWMNLVINPRKPNCTTMLSFNSLHWFANANPHSIAWQWLLFDFVFLWFMHVLKQSFKLLCMKSHAELTSTYWNHRFWNDGRI